jgi:AcrR family transcriptional regulator
MLPMRQPASRLNPRRLQICMTAARTFVERGFDATSVSDIAAALGVTKAGLYHHLNSKEDLLFDIVNLGMDWLDEDVIKPVQGINDPEERLREILVRHAVLTACNEGWITILLDEIHALRPTQRRKIENRKREYVKLVSGTLKALKGAGRLRDIDPTVGALGVLGMIVWLPRWVQPRGRMTCQQVAEQIATLALNGLLLPTGPHAGVARRR